MGTFEIPYFTVLIPVYNEGDRLVRAVQSAREQTAQELEILIVDDGSTDPESLKILSEISSCDERIRLIRKENGGVSAARNTGIREAEGRYLVFLDGDDFLEKDACEQYRSRIEKSTGVVDALYTNYYVDDEYSCTKRKMMPIASEQIFENGNEEMLRELYGRLLFNNRGCYRTDFLRQMKMTFEEKWVVFEDIDFAMRALLKAKCVVATEYAGYHYCRFRKHAGMTLRRLYSQLQASATWIDMLGKSETSMETKRMLGNKLADIMAVYSLQVPEISGSDRKKGYAYCAEYREYFKYGSIKTRCIYRLTQCIGTEKALRLIGGLYGLSHRGIVQ